MRTTPLTAYQKHVKSFAKTYKGKNLMKAAAAAWSKKSGSPKKKTRTSSPRKKGGKKTVTNKRKGGFKLPGGLGPKSIIMGALGMMFLPKLLPVPPQAAKLATGLAMRAVGIGGGAALTAVGLMELVAAYGAPLLQGVAGPPGAGGGAFPSNGVSDY